MKKVTKILLGIVLFLYFSNTTFAQCEGIFKDVPASAKNCKEIEFLYKQGNISYNTHFNTNTLISRAQFSKIIQTAFKIPLNNTGVAFPDFPKHSALYNEVMSLKNAGIVDGTSQGRFEPSMPITRAAALKMIIEASNYKFPGTFHLVQTTSQDSDLNKLKPYVDEAYKYSNTTDFKIISSSATSNNETYINRGEAAQMVANAMIPLKIQRWQCSTTYCTDIRLDGYPVFTFELEMYLNDLINQSRAEHNLQPFFYNGQLASISDSWNYQMLRSRDLKHNNNLTSSISAANIPYSFNGENVATRTISDKLTREAYFDAVKILHDTIMSQKAPDDYHKQNILSQSEAFDQIGLSVMISQDYLDSRRNRIWIVENFIKAK